MKSNAKTQKKKRWDVILELLPEGPCFVAEIGVWRGVLSRQLLERHSKLWLIQVDRWTAYGEDESEPGILSTLPQEDFDIAKEEAAKRVFPYRDRVTTHHMSSREASYLVEDNSLDGVFIDAGHRYSAVREDIEVWFPKVREGGFISGHDYPRRPGVKQAVEEWFLPSVIESLPDSVWRIRKRDGHTVGARP